MKRFVVPPTWPSPPRRSWVPPKTWRPDPAWPAAPEDWKFWVDGKGNPVRGPIGRYGGPSNRVAYAAVAAAVIFLGVNIWALSAIGLFGGKNDDPAAVQFVDDRTPSPKTTTPDGPATTGTTTTPPRVPTTATPTQPPTTRPTHKPTDRPTKTRTTQRQTEAPSTPTRTTTRTPRPSQTTATQPTEQEILRQYCIQHGWPAEWCDPNHWQGPTRPPRRSP
ncbi:hypothetical protein AB0E69_15820 [Kribbella sp. NPDC026611]|uniref:hypothetical protein n=1 Tax=Kribbella sp. NPDC026611 TaxID=3154911 RepID=UPI003406F847